MPTPPLNLPGVVWFDVAWTQHVAMNVRDRAQFYKEAFRVLKPGGLLAIYDVTAGRLAPLIFPVPWAATPEQSFLLSSEAMQSLLVEVGFQLGSWEDRTEAGIAWFRERATALDVTQRPPRLGLHLVMGAEFPMMAANLSRNLAEDRARLVEAILLRP